MRLIKDSGKENSVANKSDSDMTFAGLDIFSRIRKLIRGTTETQSLKRRCEDQPENNHFTKYRRVNNDFPKIITQPFEDDKRFLKPTMSNEKSNPRSKKTSANQYLTSTKSNIMSNFAEIEYSDDELDVDMAQQLYTSKPLASSSFNSPDLLRNINLGRNKYQFMQKSNDSARAINIPIKLLETKKPIPPLIEARTGNILGSTFMPHLRSIRKATMNGLQNHNNVDSNNRHNYMNDPATGIGYANYFNLNENNIESTNNGGVQHIDPAIRCRTVNHNNHQNGKYIGGNNIVTQEYNVKQRNTYEDLLRRIVPNLYTHRDNIIPLLKPQIRQSIHSNTTPKAAVAIAVKTPPPPQPQPPPPPHPPIDEIDLTDEINASSPQSNHVISLDDEDDDVIAYEELNNGGEYQLTVGLNNVNDQQKTKSVVEKKPVPTPKVSKPILPKVKPVNSLKEKNQLLAVYEPKWLENFKLKCKEKQRIRTQKIQEATEDVRKQVAETERHERIIEAKLRDFVISAEVPIIDEGEEEEEVEFPEFCEEDEALVKRSMYRGSPDEILIEKFNMSISRRDIQTLAGDNWLNDEVINFYMNLLMERGEKRSCDGYPKVYAMNTFFLPRLLSSGHSGVRRWTRKVDIFQYDVMPIPVHVGGVHWCMAIVHLRNKTIKYYDSMGTPNHRVLQIIEQYLRDESIDKRKIPFDTTGFDKICVPDCPRQMNGSDCGVFSCMFAEYTCRDRPITFSQQQMHYFRHKMVLEIVKGTLLM